MLSLEVKTKLSQEEAAAQVKRFFGAGGQGLRLCEETESCLSFEGGGGYVTAHIAADKAGVKIDLLSQEWDYQVKEFATWLPKSI